MWERMREDDKSQRSRAFYNAAKYLDKCIEQLLHQTIGINDLEIILVDDASTDRGETKSLIQRYEQHFPETIIAVFLERNVRQGERGM